MQCTYCQSKVLFPRNPSVNELRKHLNEVRLMSVSIAKKSSASAKRCNAPSSQPLSRRVHFSHYRCVSDLSSSPSRERNIDGVIQVTVHSEADKTSSMAEVQDQAGCSSKALHLRQVPVTRHGVCVLPQPVHQVPPGGSRHHRCHPQAQNQARSEDQGPEAV